MKKISKYFVDIPIGQKFHTYSPDMPTDGFGIWSFYIKTKIFDDNKNAVYVEQDNFLTAYTFLDNKTVYVYE